MAIKVFKCFVVLVQTEIKVGFSKHVSYRFTGNILKQKCKHRNLKWGANGGEKKQFCKLLKADLKDFKSLQMFKKGNLLILYNKSRNQCNECKQFLQLVFKLMSALFRLVFKAQPKQTVKGCRGWFILKLLQRISHKRSREINDTRSDTQQAAVNRSA